MTHSQNYKTRFLKPINTILVILVVILGALDVFLARVILKDPKFEANPVMKFMWNYIGFYSVILIKIIGTTIYVVIERYLQKKGHYPHAFFANSFAVGVYLFVMYCYYQAYLYLGIF